MYGTYEKDSVMNYAKDVVKNYLETEEGGNIYASDFTANVSNYANADGCVFIYDDDAKAFINDNYEEAQKAYDYAKFDLGMDINPFEDPHKVVSVMIDMAVNELAQNCEILQNDGRIDLDMSTCDRIMNDMGIEYDAGERFEHIGNDTIQFVHEWQEALEKNGIGALEDCPPICTPILGEYGEIIGQDFRISEVPAVWIDTSEEKICVYQAGELAAFKADPDACKELSELAIEEFGEDIDTWTLEEKLESTHSTLDTAKEGLEHYFDEGEMVKVERSLDNELASCEEKANAANDAGERFEHIGNDTIQFVHEWQEALEKKGANALEDCSPICTPILGEYGEIIGQDIRISETPAVWIDTSEEKICVYQAGELAAFKVDPDACKELSELAIEEFGEDIDTWTLEEKMESTHSALDTAKDGLEHYFDEGEMVKVERSLDNELASCEEKANATNEGIETKEVDDPER